MESTHSDLDRLVIKAGREATGNTSLHSLRFPVASLFKIVLAHGALLSEKLSSQEPLLCPDRLEDAGKQQLNLHEAMLYSSNDFFKQLLDRLDPYILAVAMQDLQFPGDPPGESMLEREWETLWHGGTITVNPMEVFHLTERLAKLARTSRYAVLVESMERPARSGSRVIGKTGTWGGAAWCTGFSLNSGTKHIGQIVTVLHRYEAPNWHHAHACALDEFYRELHE